MSKKYYRIIKDTPALTVGAILESEEGSNNCYVYERMNVWDKVEGASSFAYGVKTVQNAPEYFEQVYLLRNGKFGTLEQARAEANALYVGDEKKAK